MYRFVYIESIKDSAMKNPAASCGVSSKEKVFMGVDHPHPPLAIYP